MSFMYVTVFLFFQPRRQSQGSGETASAFEFLALQPQCPLLFTPSFPPQKVTKVWDDIEGRFGLAFWPPGLSSKEVRGEKSWEPSRRREKRRNEERGLNALNLRNEGP